MPSAPPGHRPLLPLLTQPPAAAAAKCTANHGPADLLAKELLPGRKPPVQHGVVHSCSTFTCTCRAASCHRHCCPRRRSVHGQAPAVGLVHLVEAGARGVDAAGVAHGQLQRGSGVGGRW